MAIDTNKIKTNFFSFDGRIGKKQYLMSFLILLAIGFVLGLILAMLGKIGLIILLPIRIILAVASFSIAIRRWHDLGKSGWLSLLFLIPLVNLVVLIYLCVADGTAADNKYGPVPSYISPIA